MSRFLSAARSSPAATRVTPFVALGAILLAGTASGCSGGEKPRPNLVLILADDLGWNDVGYHGSEIATPRIDAFVAEGVELDRFYVQPQCSPTRAGLLTGRHPLRFGMQATVVRPWDVLGLPARERTLADLLAGAGYRHRAIYGKWHLGHGAREHHPLSHGFTEFYGHYNGRIGYFDHTREATAEGQPARDWHRNLKAVDESGRYVTELTADAAVRFIAEHASDPDPFFLYLPFLAPHYPNEAPAEAVELQAHLPEPRRTHAAKVACLDDAIGRVLDELEASGVARDTLVVFLSDNGANPELGGSNAPLRGKKQTPFEGALRVPAAVRWPAGLAGGRKLDAFMGYLDLLPTLARACGVDTSDLELDGTDLTGVWAGEEERSASELLVLAGSGENEFLVIVDEPWKLIRVGPDLSAPGAGRGQLALFDVVRDPAEEHNLVPGRPGVVDRLLTRLRAFRELRAAEALVESTEPPAGWSAPHDWAIPD